MKITENGVKFDSIDEAVSSLAKVGLKLNKVTEEFSGVIPAEVPANYRLILDCPTPVACLERGTVLTWANKNDPQVKPYHDVSRKYFSDLAQ